MTQGEKENGGRASSKSVRKTHEPIRVKDIHNEHNHNVEGLSSDMKGFYDELYQVFPNLQVTSGKRIGGNKFSHHHEGDAIDISKNNTDVYNYLVNTKEGLALMNKYKLGILDETDPRNMQKTGATGPHFHIGKDSGLYAKTKDRYEQFDSIQPIKSFYSENPMFDYTKSDNLNNSNLDLIGPTKEASVYFETSSPENGVEPFRVILPDNQAGEFFKHEINKELAKNSLRKDKLDKSIYRQQLLQKQSELDSRVQSVYETMNKIRERDADSSRRAKVSDSTNTAPQLGGSNIVIQNTMPNLPSIFKMQ